MLTGLSQCSQSGLPVCSVSAGIERSVLSRVPGVDRVMLPRPVIDLTLPRSGIEFMLARPGVEVTLAHPGAEFMLARPGVEVTLARPGAESTRAGVELAWVTSTHGVGPSSSHRQQA